MTIVLDTQALMWTLHGAKQLGRETRRALEQGERSGSVRVSAITYWELGMLVNDGRVRLQGGVSVFRARAQSVGILEIPIDGEIAILASQLEGLHGDPADRIIFATALHEKATLITADSKLLAAKAGPKRIDAQS